MPIQCEIVTQDKMLFEGPADIVVAPGSEGEMGILPNHSPLLTTLNYGILRVRFQGEEQAFTIAGGVLEVRPDIVTVLAEGPPPETDQYPRIQAALRRSTLRLDAIRRYRKQTSRPGTPRRDEDS
jgi:F-type H+-transporting ATPase subunit epsilon